VKFNNDEINQAAEETIVALEKSIKEREQVNV
jgi:hypothetical protein